MNKDARLWTGMAIVVAAILLTSAALAAGPRSKPACSDGRDNDGDGRTDYPNDPGCSSKNDVSEYGTAECDDGIDNDGDFSADLDDSGCYGPTDLDESNCGDTTCEGSETCSSCSADCGACPECSDTHDNDGDGRVDMTDPGCVSSTDNDESNCGDARCEGGETCSSCSIDCGTCSECSDSMDNDGDGRVDYPNDSGCSGTSDNDESNCGDARCEGGESCATCSSDCGACPECGDTTDNDGDGYTDLADAGCVNTLDTDESNCGDSRCEGGETCATCSSDCGQCNSCTDTDYGHDMWNTGTVSGIFNNLPYSYTDHCTNTSMVFEYYCGPGGIAYNTIYDCPMNMTSGCIDGACQYS